MRHFMRSFSLRAFARSNEISLCQPEKRRLSTSWAMLFLSLAFLASCSSTNENIPLAGAPNPGLQKLSPSQLSSFEANVDGIGRFERATLPPGSNDDALTLTLRASLLSSDCTVADALHSAQNKVAANTLTISGSACAIHALVQEKILNGNLKIVGNWALNDPQLISQNNISSIGYVGQGILRKTTTAKTVIFHATGNFYFADNSHLDFALDSNLQFSQTGTLVSGARTHQFGSGGSIVILKMEKKSDSAPADPPLYWLNGDQITADLYNSYLSRLGSLVSGALIEAG